MRANSDTALSMRILLTLFLVVITGSQAFSQTKILLLGDSITKGVSGPSTDDAGYRNDLADSLTAEGVSFDFVGSQQNGVGFDNNHEGTDGIRADDMLAQLNAFLVDDPDMIVLHIGTNDISSLQTPESTRTEISGILDAIRANNVSTKIVLSSIIPRTDTNDSQSTVLNTLIEDLFYSKRRDGHNLYYAGVNEIFKQNPNWTTDYFEPNDNVHPNDDGYSVMAGVYLDVITVALNSPTPIITDSFDRTNVGATWSVDPEVVLQGGRLVNSATTGLSNWEYLSTYRGIQNPSSVSIEWAATADAIGINEGGIALLLDSASNNANGYLAWITTNDNNLRLWTVTNGRTGSDLNVEIPSLASVPTAGSVFRVDVTVGVSSLVFDYYVDNVFGGTVSVANPGLNPQLYSGIITKHALNNDVEAFIIEKDSDTIQPGTIQDVSVAQATASTIDLSWTATGDDGIVGQASSYDLRYSAQSITGANFYSAIQANGIPTPTVSGSIENITLTGLQAGSQYFIAVKAVDEAGNAGSISNVVSSTTVAGNFFTDDFERTVLGNQWTTAANYEIVDNRLSNIGGTSVWNELAILNIRKNPGEVSFKFGENADVAGIDQTGFVLVFNSPDPTGAGYVISRRTGKNEIRLWQLIGGLVGGNLNPIDVNISPNLPPPSPGDVVKIVMSTTGLANRFEYFINDQFDGAVEDSDFLYNMGSDKWAGVALNGGMNNDVDNFTILLEVGGASDLLAFSGDNQIGTVSEALAAPLTVKVTDDAGSPVGGINVNFEVLTGGGSVDVQPPKEEIVIEAESGVLTSPMIAGSDANASVQGFVYVPEGAGGAQTGKAEYTINIAEAGDYVIWARAINPDGDSDVFYVKVDGIEYFWDIGQRKNKTTWTWDEISDRGAGTGSNPDVDPVIFTFGAGIHTVVFREGKDGAQLDQFVVVKENSGWLPPSNESPVLPGGAFTNSSGLASTNLTLGPSPGSNTVRAFANGLPDVIFTATGTAGNISAITKISGEGQRANPGEQLAQAFVIEVLDSFGNPAIGSTTTWTLKSGNGSLSNGANVIVDASGRASNTLTISTDTGINEVQITSDVYNGLPVIFTAYANAGAPVAVDVLSPTTFEGTASTALGAPFQVRVVDAIGTPVTGSSVIYRVISGGGNFDSVNEVTLISDADGIAAATLTLGPSPGETNQAQAIVTGLQGSPVTFTATSAEPLSIEAISSLTHSGTASVPLVDSIKVLVKDKRNQPLPNYPVEFTVFAGDGSANGSATTITVPSNSQGIAQALWRLGPSAGSSNNRLRVAATFNSKALTGSPIVFTASAAVGNAANLVQVSGNNQSGQVETILDDPFKVRITDSSNNPVVGWPITFSVKEGGGNFNGSSSVLASTNANGEASATLTLGSSAGTPNIPFNNIIEAVAQNFGVHLNGSPIIFQASAIATGARALVLIEGDGQVGDAGLALPKQIQVKVTDGPNNNGIAGHEVVFTVSGGGGTLNGTSKTTLTQATDGNGIALVSWYLGGDLQVNGQTLQVRATDGISDLQSSPITLRATAIAGQVDPDASQVLSDVSSIQADGTAKASITVILTDKFGNAIPNKAVTIGASGSNNQIDQPTSLTNSVGKAFGSISSTRSETKSITAFNLTDGVQLNTTATVSFLSQPPDQVEASSSLNQTANVGTAVSEPIAVLVTDDFNNPVPGVRVKFEVTGGGGSIIKTSEGHSGSGGNFGSGETTTGENGIAYAIWVLGTSPGANTARVRAFYNGLALGGPISFSAQGVSSTATTLSYLSGNNQEGLAGLPAAEPLAVVVTDDQGLAIAGIPVRFVIEAGNGSIVTPNPVTNYQGVASTKFLLDKSIGLNVVRADSPSLPGSTVQFQVNGLVGGPAKMAKFAGDNSQAPANSQTTITIQIMDFYGNPIAGAESSFRVVQGGGAVQSNDNKTDSRGLASAVILMPNQMEEVVVRASSNALVNFYKEFTLYTVATSAQNFEIYGGNDQDGTVGRSLVHPLVVKVTDQFGNPVAGQEVQWLRTIGGGEVSNDRTTTNDEGLAITEFTVGAKGNNQALAIAALLTPGQLTFDAKGVNNNFPLFDNLQDQQVTEGQLLQYKVGGSDLDNDPLTYEAQNLPSGASFNLNSRTLSWTPDFNKHGEYVVNFFVRDGRGGYDFAPVQITVLNANTPPIISNYTPQETANLLITNQDNTRFSIVASDPDPGSGLSYEWRLFADHLPDEGKLLSTSESFDLVASNYSLGSYQVVGSVSDGNSEDDQNVTWNMDISKVTSVELAAFDVDFNGFDGVGISWKTSKQLDNAGFRLLRSERKDRDYQDLTDGNIKTSESGEYTFFDRNVETNRRYYYKLVDVDLSGDRTEHGPIEIFVAAPEKFELSQNYPNPFNPATNIRFQIAKAGLVTLKIYDVLGREVRALVNEKLAADFHTFVWDGRNQNGVLVSSGIYFYRMVSGKFIETKRMLLMK